jgi:hypothetical protein
MRVDILFTFSFVVKMLNRNLRLFHEARQIIHTATPSTECRGVVVSTGAPYSGGSGSVSRHADSLS